VRAVGLLGSEQDRRRITAAVTDPLLRGFWDWYEQLSDAARAQAAGPLMNKLRAFLLRPFVRAAVAAGPSTFTMTGVLDQGGLLLARLPKGVLGEETSRLLGSFLVASAWQAASARAGLPEHLRPDAALYLDECHNFLTLPYPLEEMLAEARAYRLALVMAHQNLAQLPPGPAGGDLRQRPQPGHLHRQPRRRPDPGTTHAARAGRARPVAPGRLPGRRPADRQGAAGTRVHPAHLAAAPAGTRPRRAHPPRRRGRQPRKAARKLAFGGRRGGGPAQAHPRGQPDQHPGRQPPRARTWPVNGGTTMTARDGPAGSQTPGCGSVWYRPHHEW
jgi:hypothetical protein